METKRKNRFWKGLLIYILVMLAVIAVGLAVFWQYMAAYEAARPEGTMDAWIETRSDDALSGGIARWAEEHASARQSAQSIADDLTGQLEDAPVTYRKVVGTYTDSAPVYTLRAGTEPVGTLALVAGDGKFGMNTWSAGEPAWDFSAFASTLTILAPEGAEVSVNGAALNAADAQAGELHPDLAEFADDLADAEGIVTYTVTDLYGPAEVTAADAAGHPCLVETGEDGTVSVSQVFPAELEPVLRSYTQDFVTAYIAFTSHAVEEPGEVQSYLIPGSELSQRMYAAQDGLSWVQGVTASMSGLTLENFRYFGSAVLCDARYTLTSGTGATENEMCILLTETASGWRVANMKLF